MWSESRLCCRLYVVFGHVRGDWRKLPVRRIPVSAGGSIRSIRVSAGSGRLLFFREWLRGVPDCVHILLLHFRLQCRDLCRSIRQLDVPAEHMGQ
jgi:hypothetical protein